MFPVNDVERLEQFETCHLEWLAVFLSVPCWTPNNGVNETFEEQGFDVGKAPFNSTGVAIDNLRAQLGLSSHGCQCRISFSDLMSSFPLFKGALPRTFWGNRNILEVSLHIDNVLALTAGSQHRFMVVKKRETGERIPCALQGMGITDLKEPYHPRESTEVASGSTPLMYLLRTAMS